MTYLASEAAGIKIQGGRERRTSGALTRAYLQYHWSDGFRWWQSWCEGELEKIVTGTTEGKADTHNRFAEKGHIRFEYRSVCDRSNATGYNRSRTELDINRRGENDAPRAEKPLRTMACTAHKKDNMSHIIAEGRPIHTLWSAERPRLGQDKKSVEQMDEVEKIPETLETLMTWAFVQHWNDKRVPEDELLHATPDGAVDGEMLKVGIRLQGFVKAAQLDPFGDWKKTEGDAPRARQKLILYGGDEEAVFSKQGESLNRIRELIHKSMRSRNITEQNTKRIHLYRSVFEKCRPGHKQHRWLVTEKIRFGTLAPSGLPRAASWLDIKVGDFVDVTVFPKIYKSRGPAGEEVKVSFAMSRIVRLQSGKSKTEEKSKPAPSRRVATRDDMVWEDGEMEVE
ncbi:hypothetical protein NM688_g847 [Phlebia brevispora]|uniref:Uncharacterized protein n=1 Tax=Phlebia brevispora TaxID=194682 RepID=A0ACC1TD74_9APHY|nr:hypothetical protein NM688_g847 [Phlebia brevispora]